MKKIFFAILTVALIASCALKEEVKKELSAPAVLVVPEDDLPLMVAVMPFQNDTQEIGIATQVRRAFYNHFSSKPYRDVELNVIDEKVVQLEKSSGAGVLDIKPDEICQSLGCDGVVYGRITDYKKVYAAVYSQLGVEAEVWMVNTKTGKEVLKIKDSVRYHEGGVPMSPLGVVMTAVSTAMNIREIQQVRLVNELSYKFNERIPSPKGLKTEDRPLIREILTNVKEGPFSKGRIIRAGLEGEPGLVATFDIGNFKKGILMKETKPGIYMGEYLVMPGDNTKDMPIIASLKRPAGYESQWIDVSGFVIIDTTAPPQVKGIRAKGFQDRIEISWEALKNIPDLKGYTVLRSEQPLSGYAEISRVELNTYEDRTAKPDTAYYYRVTASDQTGNESESADPVTAALMSKEPVLLSGELKKDTVLSGVYIVKDTFTVPKGLSLSLAPETRVMFDENAALVIYGRTVIDGKGAPVEFIPSGDKKWKGITAEGGNVTASGMRIKGALAAVTFKNTEGQLEDAVVSDSETGILISGTPAASLKGLTVSGNKTGIELQKTDARISQSSIFQNTDGVVMREFSGELKDNNIIDNGRNIFSEAPVKISANYLGSINIDEMKVSGVSIAKTYDNKIPDGKIVDAISNPYAQLSQEERQKKALELIIEAGGYFRQSNYGKASSRFEEALKAFPTADTYYYLALSYQGMKEDEKALKYLKEGVEKFPKDSTLQKALGLMYYQAGNETEAKKVFEEVMRLSPEDRQVKFLLERIGN